MQKELTINLSDETYQGLMNLVGEKNASQFIESVLRPHVSESNGDRIFKILSPHLVNPADAERLKLEIVEESSNV
jgi:hypothetical protein